jgi:NTP pyrophosphatase (non-canonical NTP hydrolase)
MITTLDDFEVHVQSSAKGVSGEIPYCALALAGEAGELANVVKKWIRDGGTLDAEAVALELGDVLWYVTALALALGYSLEDIADANVEKLKVRRAAGKATG